MSLPVMGVDPGVRGGLAVLSGSGKVEYLRGFAPGMTELELARIIECGAGMLKSAYGTTCFFEKVGFIKGDGGLGSFTFGRVVGLLRGCLLSSGISIHDVYPAMWQASMECLTGGNKNVSKKRAIELFPDQKITHNIADALLIAEFGRRRLASVERGGSP